MSELPYGIRLLRDRVIMALLVGATAWVSLSIARVPGGVAAVWVSNGIWAGWLLSRRTALWPGYLAAGSAVLLGVRLLTGDGALAAAALTAFNLLEVMIIPAPSGARFRMSAIRSAGSAWAVSPPAARWWLVRSPACWLTGCSRLMPMRRYWPVS